MTATATAAFHPYSWAPAEIADKTYSVTAARAYGQDFEVGGLYWDQEITAIEIYTGFAGCPARYYVTTARGTYILPAE